MRTVFVTVMPEPGGRRVFTRSWTVGAWITLTEEAIRSSKVVVVVVVRMKVGAK